MAIDENDPRLKDMLRAIELGETLEDLDDPEDYDDMGGINSLKRKPPSIKMASEPEDEFELELGTVIKEYNDLKEQGIIRDISIEEYIDKYLSKKRKSPNKMMASMEENEKEFMRLVEEFMEQGFNQQQAIEAARDTLERKSVAMGGPMRMGYAGGSEDIVEPSKSMQVDTTTYPLGQDPDNFPIKKEGSKIDLDIEMIKKLIEKRKKEKKKLAMGGIAGVL
jgi:DNA-binding transcriptional regulator YhcF (GntR family)